jgi:hypothetical protein
MLLCLSNTRLVEVEEALVCFALLLIERLRFGLEFVTIQISLWHLMSPSYPF